MKTLIFILLFPFSLIYGTIVKMRNHLYHIGSKPSVGFDLPTICVGNLTVGGTGKTPHIEFLIRLLKDKFQIATLSRGYGRKTKGYILAENKIHSHEIGDEPMQYFQKFGKEIAVAVGEERILAVSNILMDLPDTNVILLDDAFQHRKIQPSLNILLTDFNRPFYQDYFLPAGRLRDSRAEAKRAEIIVVSKCPQNLAESKQIAIEQEIREYAKSETPIFFSSIRYSSIQPINKNTNDEIELEKVILLTGIAQTEPLEKYVSECFEILEHIKLKDHADYDASVSETILSVFERLEKEKPMIITTEKDAVKLAEIQELRNLPIYALPIEVYFLRKQSDFEKLIFSHIQEMNKKTAEF
ncbi:MAG: tetraacyldisaccharide 4'-kinase [Arenicella sp.]|jgi:tetraacyldisaccharide 4'-kinase